jgi:hypothetical protein
MLRYSQRLPLFILLILPLILAADIEFRGAAAEADYAAAAAATLSMAPPAELIFDAGFSSLFSLRLRHYYARR